MQTRCRGGKLARLCPARRRGVEPNRASVFSSHWPERALHGRGQSTSTIASEHSGDRWFRDREGHPHLNRFRTRTSRVFERWPTGDPVPWECVG